MIPALESDSHSLVSPLFLPSQTTTPVVQWPKEKWAGKRSEGVPFSLRFIILRYNSKYQSKGPIYVLHLFAFAAIRLFELVYLRAKKKKGFGKAMKKVRDARLIFVGMRDQHPSHPLQTMNDQNKV